jgi:hypothetical protein
LRLYSCRNVGELVFWARKGVWYFWGKIEEEGGVLAAILYYLLLSLYMVAADEHSKLCIAVHVVGREQQLLAGRL